MAVRGFYILLVSGVSSIVMQIIGQAVPAWIRIKVVSVDKDQTVSTGLVNFGLYQNQYCGNINLRHEEECLTLTFPETTLMIYAKGGDTVFDYSGSVQKCLLSALGGGMLCFLGLILMCLYLHKNKGSTSKCFGGFGASLWILGAISSSVAVVFSLLTYSALQLTESPVVNITRDVDVNPYFPWAVIFTGIGSLLALVTGIKICHKMHTQYRANSG